MGKSKCRPIWSATFSKGSRCSNFRRVVWQSVFTPKRPSGGHCGAFAWVLVWQFGHRYWNSIKSMTCLFWRLGSSSIR